MPFPQQEPRPFTHAEVERLAPGQRGCYGLLRNGTFIYVGRSQDMRARLLQHLNGDSLCVTLYGPTHFVGVVTKDDEAEELALILELRPLCNQRLA